MSITSNNHPFTLPAWMRPQPRSLDWGLLLVLILSLLAAMPFLLQAGLPRETDAELHVFRTAELIYLLEHGDWFPRWAPNFWYGYGYPFFNYYGAFSYYLAGGLGLLAGAGPVTGARIVFVLAHILAGVGTYAFVRRRWGTYAGLVSSAVYVYSPYVTLIDPHMRGDMAETLALGLIPMLFWAFDCVWTNARGHHIAAAVLGLAALIFTHNLMALIGFVLLAGWLLWQHRFAPGDGRPAFTWAVLALGVLLASFFWLPVFLESGSVQLDRLTGPGHFDYQNHFLGLAELLGMPPRLDWGAANPAFSFSLGPATWLLALAGGAGLLLKIGHRPLDQRQAATLDQWRQRLAVNSAGPTSRSSGHSPYQARDVIYFAGAGLVLILLMLPVSRLFWQFVPLMPLFQFPWRFLGMAALCCAVVAGAATRWLERLPRRARPVGLSVMLALPLFAALPVLYPPPWSPDFGPTDPSAYLAFELEGIALGTTSGGEYLPQTVDVPPGPARSLIDSYNRPGYIDKVNRATLPAETKISIVAQSPTEDQWLVQSSEPFLLRLYTFAFPGWQSEVNGEPVEYEIAEPEGFIAVPVPAGTNQVRVYFGLTPLRAAAMLISLLCLPALVGLYIVAEWRRKQPSDPMPLLDRGGILAVLLVLLAFGGTRLATNNQDALFYSRTPPGEVPPGAASPYQQSFQIGIDLLGYDLPTTVASPGQTLPVTVYWYAREPIAHNYQVFVHLVPLGSSTPVAQSDKLNPGDYPTTRWTNTRYIRDTHRLALPDDLAPGEYLIFVGLYDHTNGTRLMTESDQPDDKMILPSFVYVR